MLLNATTLPAIFFAEIRTIDRGFVSQYWLKTTLNFDEVYVITSAAILVSHCYVCSLAAYLICE